MLLQNDISEKAKRKLQLYSSAMFLFDKGKSHPQIVTILQEFEHNQELIIDMVDKAMHDEWDNLYAEAKILFSEGRNYNEVLRIISEKEPDTEIATWICSNWYNLKVLFAECIIDGATNRFEGIKYIIICGLAIIILFYFGSSWFAKVIWIIALAGSVFQWIVGIQQRDIQNTIKLIFSLDIENAEIDEEEKNGG